MGINTSPNTESIVHEDTALPNEGALLTSEQAYTTYKTLVQDNRERNRKNSAVARKRDGEQPWSPTKLKAAGQGWRSNRPTGFMNSLLKRLTPPYKQIIDQLPKLTYSKFPIRSMGREAQEGIFQTKITDTIRAWEGWGDFTSRLIDEDVVFGYTAAVSLDDYEWKPDVFRGDEILFPVGAPQDVNKLVLFGLRQNKYVHEMVELLKHPKAIADAGWKVTNLIKKLNTSGTEFQDYSNEENSRIYQDLVRENNLGSSFSSSVRVVTMGHLITLDPTGGVNHYIFDREDGMPLFFRRKRWRHMREVIALFAAEIGDRTLHGSRGAGRTLYNTHISVEQARNLVQDAQHLSGLVILKRTKREAGSGATEGAALSVNHPFAIIGEGYEALEGVKFEMNAESFIALDQQATSQAEVAVGSFMPGQITNQKGDKRTASEINYTASIDAQIRTGILGRFADQAFGLIGLMQRRICHPEVLALAEKVATEVLKVQQMPIYDQDFWGDLEKAQATEGFVQVILPDYIDPVAVQACAEMMNDGLTKQQILILANESCRANVDDAIASQSGILDMLLQSYAMDPMIDGVELKRRHLSSKIGSEAAERLLRADLSPASDIREAFRQMTELSIMLDGNDMPVQPEDNNIVHLETMKSRAMPIVQASGGIGPMAHTVAFMTKVLAHANAHIAAAKSKGAKPQQLKPYIELVKSLGEFVQQKTLEVQAGAAIDAATANSNVPGGMPISVGGGGMAPAGAGGGQPPALPAAPAGGTKRPAGESLLAPAPGLGATPQALSQTVANPERPRAPMPSDFAQ